MVSLESPPPVTAKSAEPTSSPRISFSADLLEDEEDDEDFICINPHHKEKDKEPTKPGEFEFLSTNSAAPSTMLTADELFFEGKLLPFGQKQCSEKLMKINLTSEQVNEVVKVEESTRMSWFIDEDPSPRPPKCTVLWKELLRLRKHRASSLSTSASTSSSSSASSIEDAGKKEKQVKRMKKGLDRTRSAGIKLRPMVNLPVCTHGVRSNSMPPLSSSRKGTLDRKDEVSSDNGFDPEESYIFQPIFVEHLAEREGNLLP